MIFKNRNSKWGFSSYFSRLGAVLITAFFLSILTNSVQAQTKVIQQDQDTTSQYIYTVVDKEPEFPGGKMAMYKFLGKTIQYPADASRRRISGRVLVTFVITTEGSIENIEVLEGPGYGLNEEAVRVISLFPKWKPGIHNGEPVNVQYNLPINFQTQ